MYKNKSGTIISIMLNAYHYSSCLKCMVNCPVPNYLSIMNRHISLVMKIVECTTWMTNDDTLYSHLQQIIHYTASGSGYLFAV